MTPDIIMTIGQRALEITMLLAAPLLLAALLIGLLVVLGVGVALARVNPAAQRAEITSSLPAAASIMRSWGLSVMISWE